VMIADLQSFITKNMIPDTLRDDAASIISMLNDIEIPGFGYNSLASALTDSSITK
jgi:hypothetical protein